MYTIATHFLKQYKITCTHLLTITILIYCQSNIQFMCRDVTVFQGEFQSSRKEISSYTSKKVTAIDTQCWRQNAINWTFNIFVIHTCVIMFVLWVWMWCRFRVLLATRYYNYVDQCFIEFFFKIDCAKGTKGTCKNRTYIRKWQSRCEHWSFEPDSIASLLKDVVWID